MKSIAIFLILFIIKSSISKDNIEAYSIEKFIARLQKDGLYEKINSLKLFLEKTYLLYFVKN